MARRGIVGNVVWYARVVLLMAVALASALVLEPLIEPDFSPIFLGAIALATWLWGFGAGILGTFLSCLSMLYLFLPPHYTLEIPSWPVFFRELSFVVTAALIIWLVRRFANAERGLRASLEDIRTKEERFRIALLKSPVVVIHQNADLRYLWVYNPFQEHTGMTLVGKTDADLFPPGEAEQLTRIKARVLATGIGAHEEVKLTTGGELRTMDLNIEPLRDSAGRLTGIIGTAVDVTERQRNEEHLKSSREQLRSLATHLQSLREEERALTSREIHDRVGQMLSALDIQLGVMALQLSQGGGSATVMEQIKAISELLSTTIESSAKISAELRPSLLDNFGLAAAIESEARDFETRTGIHVAFCDPLTDIPMPSDVSTAAFRIFQEILANVEWHSAADQVQVGLRQEGRHVILRVRDNGRGIREDEIGDSRSLGILGMRERARRFGGTMSIQGSPGKGTTVCFGLPIGGEASEEALPATGRCNVLGKPGEAGGLADACPLDGLPCATQSRPLA